MRWNQRLLATLVLVPPFGVHITTTALAEELKRDIPAVSTPNVELPPIPPGMHYLPDQIYYIPDDDSKLAADILLPRNAKGPRPAVVCLHGGGWLKGSRKTNLPVMIKLAEAGYVAVSVQYRLAPKYPFPAAVHDVKCAVRWLRANARVFSIDIDRVAALGYSSGGTMACLLGLTTPLDGLEGDGPFPTFSSAVQAVVSYYGISDLAQWQVDNPFLARISVSSYLKSSPDKLADLLAKSCPMSYARGDLAAVFMIHGPKDSIVSSKQSERLRDALTKVGATVRYREIEDAGHNFTGDAEDQADAAGIKFLDEILRPKETGKMAGRRER
jgi:acetyl esterase/lipase